jgi:hypothetical protein
MSSTKLQGRFRLSKLFGEDAVPAILHCAIGAGQGENVRPSATTAQARD